MLPLFDMMMQAQNGNGLDAFARQVGIAQEEAAKAMAALMPAFSTGLKRNARTPVDFTEMMVHLSSGNYARYFEDLESAFSPQGISDGNSVLGQIFGSKEASRAIAAQAAQMSGIGQDVLKAIMPALAGTLMGGLLKQASDQMEANSQGYANQQAMQEMMAPWMQAMGFQQKPKPHPMGALFDNPVTQSMQALFGGRSAPAPAAANPFADNPFARAFQSMMANAGKPVSSADNTQTAEATPAALDDFFNTMFDCGLEVQKNYQKSLESIFDAYKPKDTKQPA